MSNREKKNIADSILQRLKNYSQMQREDRGLTLTNYAIERFLYRLSNSQYAGQFVLKGAQLFRVWGNNPYRPTRDLDLLGFGNPDVSQLEEVFRNICRVETDVQDGIIYKAESVRGQAIREDNMYDGVRIKLEYRIGRTGEFMQIDIGFGDAVDSSAKMAAFPSILNMPAPELRVYPYELAVAEKVEAMAALGFANSRMKDFYDVYQLAGEFEFDGKLLAQAIQTTFKRRGTVIPEGLPTAFTKEFYEDKLKLRQWEAFISKNSLKEISFPSAADKIKDFILPVLRALAENKSFELIWKPGRQWSKERKNWSNC
ncbi:nucleotidyl transferase AbiEii/AbiGii toxin family protein [Sedimentisphaera salicampi]|uniref:nucleotidyl transferase AbiEii/AbiGii toxin family protein n=1 Tax=Sedimentisphaera salicampi TaxID=1941349 RepID=UPI000B9AEB5A|nr:nucleotidyl transferase AbiEii/AbiGii toxin family protein [Sedimentisphaera salicampi]OXU14490.1 hypothetical protein SMSP1_01800 [Sedimentisphaera salicampi]